MSDRRPRSLPPPSLAPASGSLAPAQPTKKGLPESARTTPPSPARLAAAAPRPPLHILARSMFPFSSHGDPSGVQLFASPRPRSSLDARALLGRARAAPRLDLSAQQGWRAARAFRRCIRGSGGA